MAEYSDYIHDIVKPKKVSFVPLFIVSQNEKHHFMFPHVFNVWHSSPQIS